MLNLLLDMIGYGIDLDEKESEETDKDDMYLRILRNMYEDTQDKERD